MTDDDRAPARPYEPAGDSHTLFATGRRGRGRLRRTDIDKPALDRLYSQENLSTAEVAEVFGVHAMTIRRRLTEYGIERHSRESISPAFVIGDDYDDELQRVLRYVNGELAGGRRDRDDVDHLIDTARIHLRQSGRTEQRVA